MTGSADDLVAPRRVALGLTLDGYCHTSAFVRVYRRKPKSERKQTVLSIRVTEVQRQIFEDAARFVGLDISNWMRSISIREARRLVAEGRREAGS